MSVLDGYRPRGATPQQWEAVRPVEALLSPLPSDKAAMSCRTPAAKFALHLLAQGHHVTAELLVRDEAIEAFCASHANVRTAATYRSRLRRLANLHRPQRAALSSPLHEPRSGHVPYSENEVGLMLAHARALGTRIQRVTASGLVLAGAGAGLDGRDLVDLPATAVRRNRNGVVVVDVGGSRQPRQVAVLRRYADELFDVARETLTINAQRRLIGGFDTRNVTEAAVRRFDGYGGPDVSPARLRATWIAAHLRARTPLHVLMPAAGVRSLRAVERVAVTMADELPESQAMQLLAEALQ